MNNRVTFPRLIFCLLWALAFANSAEAAVSVRHPGAVGEGLPFFVRVAADEPLAGVTVRWLGKEVPATVEKRGRGSVATVLLGMGLRDKLKGASFALEVESKTASGAKIYKAEIQRTPREFPVERLTVKKSFTQLSKEVEERTRRERKEVDAALATISLKRWWTCPFTRPVPGASGSVFGLRRFFNNEPRSPHNGVDFSGAAGEPIVAVTAGTVILAPEHFYSGNAVYLDHGQGVISMYFHLSETHMRVGQSVKAGEIVGLVGATGRVTGPHLHFGLRVAGQAVDPLPLMDGDCGVE